MAVGQLLFEVIVGDHKYTIFTDGTVEGFGEGALVFNRYHQLLIAHDLESKKKSLIASEFPASSDT